MIFIGKVTTQKIGSTATTTPLLQPPPSRPTRCYCYYYCIAITATIITIVVSTTYDDALAGWCCLPPPINSCGYSWLPVTALLVLRASYNRTSIIMIILLLFRALKTKGY